MKDFKFSYTFTHSFSHSHTVFTHAELFWQNFGQSYHVWSLKECILAGILKYGVITGIWPLTRAKGPHERGSRLPIMGKGPSASARIMVSKKPYILVNLYISSSLPVDCQDLRILWISWFFVINTINILENRIIIKYK